MVQQPFVTDTFVEIKQGYLKNHVTGSSDECFYDSLTLTGPVRSDDIASWEKMTRAKCLKMTEYQSICLFSTSTHPL